ncbi:unnamed protein product [Somion occarium]|uniref:Protein kinase domain-containing protein n=1 Tax=Somion occarium TaxID=3059160 RepID=A0ABP1DQP6_9APHY
MSSSSPDWMSTFEEFRRNLGPTLNKVEEGVRRLKSGDPSSMKSLAKLVHGGQEIIDKLNSDGLRKVAGEWIEETVEGRANEILKELGGRPIKDSRRTAFVTEVTDSSSDHEIPPKPAEQPSASSSLKQSAHSIMSLVTEAMSDTSNTASKSEELVQIVFGGTKTMAQDVVRPVESASLSPGDDAQLGDNALHDQLLSTLSPQTSLTTSSSAQGQQEDRVATISSTVLDQLEAISKSSSASELLRNVIGGTKTMVQTVVRPVEPASLVSGDDAQLAIDALHDQLLFTLTPQVNPSDKLRSLQLLKRLSITHNKLPRKLFLPDVECNVAAGPVQWGSFADIYLGMYRNQPVALKFLRMFQNTSGYKGMKRKKNFYREALIWAHSSKHPHVLPILGINDTCFKHGMCMVLPWMEHGRIGEYIEKLQDNEDFDNGQEQVDRWILQIAKGLASLHEEEIVHGDLRGANVLLDSDLNARVADFGLATVAEDYATQTSTGGRLPNWLAPELLDPFAPFTPTKASDVYAFGCVCIEMYTGKAPYAGLSTWQLLEQVRNGHKPARPNFYDDDPMSDELWSLVDRCLSMTPADRPTAEAVAIALSGLR